MWQPRIHRRFSGDDDPGCRAGLSRAAAAYLCRTERPSACFSNMTADEVKELRKEFPILSEQVHGQPLIYLDNAASSQKPLQVIDAEAQYYRHSHSNVHRGVHQMSQRATEAFEQARKRGYFSTPVKPLN